MPQQVLATGGAEFGLAWVPKALVSREGGADIVNIAQVFERSGTLEVSFKTRGSLSRADWAGKKVGNWGFGNEFELTAAIEQFNVPDVELVGQSFDMLALLNGEIDAAEAMIYNEYAQVLEAENPDTGELYTADDLNVIDFNDIGTAMLQDAVWVNADWMAERQRGHRRAIPQGNLPGLDPLPRQLRRVRRVVLDNGSTLGESHQEWQLNEILGLVFPATERDRRRESSVVGSDRFASQPRRSRSCRGSPSTAPPTEQTSLRPRLRRSRRQGLTSTARATSDAPSSSAREASSCRVAGERQYRGGRLRAHWKSMRG